jgi:hypothetical protein
MIIRLINKIKTNPLIALGWSLFTISVGFLFTEEFSYPDRADYFEKAYLEISNLKMEYDRAASLIDIYFKTAKQMTDAEEIMKSEIDNKFPNIKKEDIKKNIAAQIEQRRQFSMLLALLQNAHFENKLFAEIFSNIESGVVYADKFIAKRTEFLNLILNDLPKANKMAPSLRLGIEHERVMLAQSARGPAIDFALEKARQEYNAKLRTAQRKESLHKLQKNLRIAASGYIGFFSGGMIGYYFYRKRKKRQSLQDKALTAE